MEKAKKLLKLLVIWVVVEIVILIVFGSVFPDEQPSFAFCLIWLVLLCGSTILLSVLDFRFVFQKKERTKKPKKEKPEKEKLPKEKRLKEKESVQWNQLKEDLRKSMESRVSCKLKLVGGLPFPERTTCKVMCRKELMSFTANGQEVSLDPSKIVDISVMTDSEVQKQYVSSAGGAVAGMLLLGPLGAILGGSVQQKKWNNKKKYLIITYSSEDEIKYLVFDVTQNTYAGNNVRNFYKTWKKKPVIKSEL